MDKRLIRIFVSSTFSDFVEERKALNDIVFPRLRDYCAARGFVFQAVDLRWGISEGAALEHDTINICLEEIERCQRVSSKPNFFLLLGNRYGWQPLPQAIEQQELDALRGHLQSHRIYGDSAALISRWYGLDTNAVPAQYVLQNRGDTDEATWDTASELLLEMLRTAAREISLPEQAQEKYYLSATGYEIVKGALSFAERGEIAEHQVLCFFREIEDIGAHVDIDHKKTKWLDGLKKRLDGKFPQYTYKVQINKWGQEKGALNDFCDHAEAMLTKAIDARVAEFEDGLSPLALEREQHRNFMEERAQDFYGREEIVAGALGYIHAPEGRSLLICGHRGIGKSSVTAKIIHTLVSEPPRKMELVYRFTGATAESADSFSLVSSLCEDIAQHYGRDFSPPGSYAEACLLFKKSLGFATADCPLCVIVDAVDQLVAAADEDTLLWLGGSLPPNVMLILSTREGDYADYAAGRMPNPILLPLAPLEADHARQVLQHWLARRERALTPAQTDLVIDRFRETGLPIYLRLAFEQAVRWRSWEEPALTPGIDGIISDYLAYLSRESKHGREFVFKALGYLSCAKSGLSENELIEILSIDDSVMQDYRRRSPQSPKTDKLPFMVWSRFYFDVAPYFKEINMEGASLLQFYHLQIRDTVEDTFLEEEQTRTGLHHHLSRYFSALPMGRGGHPNLRKLSELPYHMMQTDDTGALFALVTDEPYMRAKVESGQLGALMDEGYWLLQRKKGDEALWQTLAETLFRFVTLYNNDSGERQISLEDLHSLLIFRKDRSFHSRVFGLGAEEETIRALCPGISPQNLEETKLLCIARLINFNRRLGLLSAAEELTGRILAPLEGDDTKILDYARVLYDLGYIRFLQGRFEEGRENMQKSAQASEQGGDVVGKWISLCVAAHINNFAWLDTPRQDEALLEDIDTLLEALTVFEQYSDSKLNAKRWIANVKQHLVVATFLLGDAPRLKQYALEYMNDPWVKSFDDKSYADLVQAKVYSVDGRYEEACASIKAYMNHKLDIARIDNAKVESLAECYYLLGKWSLALGRIDEAKDVFGQGLALDDEPGNHKWRARIRVALTGMQG